MKTSGVRAWIRPLLPTLLLVALAACATRSVPRSPSSESAPSPRAAAAPRPPIAVMLEEDPPLPGEANARWQLWPGLAPDVPSGAPGGHPQHGPPSGEPDERERPDSRGAHEHDAHPGGGR